jgi:GAF domain-containing protein/ActR/RegA family two-component response regulator
MARKIVILDDRSDILGFLLDQVLKPSGYETLVAKDTEEGLHKGLWENPDLIILASLFLSASTLAIHRTIQSRLPDIPVIITASYGSRELAEEALHQGVRSCILKPFTAEEVKEAIEGTLKGAPEEETLAKRVGEEKIAPPRKVIPKAGYVHAIGKSIISVLEMEKVLARIVEAAIYLTAADEGSLLLVEGEDRFKVRAAKARGERYARPLQKVVEDRIATQVVSMGKPQRQRGPREHEWSEMKTGHLVEHLLYVPLMARNEVIAILCLFNRDAGRPFLESDLDNLVALADYAATALQNAQLFENLLQGYEDLKQIRERETPQQPPRGIERRKGERRVEERRKGERRVEERRQEERRVAERRQGESPESLQVERRQGKRRREERRQAERREEERRKGDRRQAERRKGERRADLPWAETSESEGAKIASIHEESLLDETRRSEVAEKLVGRVTHYYSRIGAALVEVTDTIKVGDTIHIKGGTRDFEQTVDSMEIEHQNVEVATKGQSIGLKVIEKVRENDLVYKVE